MFAPVRRLESKLSSRIAEQIQALIAKRRLKEGDRLPPAPRQSWPGSCG